MRALIERLLFWASTAMAAVALVLMVVTLWIESGNEARQARLQERAQVIADAAQRSRSSPLVRDLVIAAQKEQNARVRALLTKYGIPYQQPAPPAAAPPAGPEAPQAPAQK